MSKRAISAIGLVALLVCATVASAQRGGPPQGRGQGGPTSGSGRDMVNRSFEAAAPGVGELMPDLTVHADDGTELELQDVLRGHYTVLILGCLT